MKTVIYKYLLIKKKTQTSSPKTGVGGFSNSLLISRLENTALRLLPDGSDAGEILAFDGLEHGAATGGDVAHLVGEAHLGDCCN